MGLQSTFLFSTKQIEWSFQNANLSFYQLHPHSSSPMEFRIRTIILTITLQLITPSHQCLCAPATLDFISVSWLFLLSPTTWPQTIHFFLPRKLFSIIFTNKLLSAFIFKLPHHILGETLQCLPPPEVLHYPLIDYYVTLLHCTYHSCNPKL